MSKMSDWWDKKHQKYASEDWVDKTTIFAKWAINYFPKSGKMLELGAGHGQDSRFFAGLGYQVISTDFSDTAIYYNTQKTPKSLKDKMSIQKVDSSKTLPYKSETFDIVYCHLALHFFDDQKTKEVFSELKRVLKKDGILAVLTNSIDDPEYGTGVKLGPDYFELSPGDVKHFFSLAYTNEITKGLKTIVLDNHGTSHKDNAKGVFNLIRYIGKKI
jgi:SAM-dependent methyltransferase